MILVDSHVLLWIAADPKRVSRRATDEIIAARMRAEPLAVAAPTLYEFALAITRNRVSTTFSLDYLLDQVTSRFAVVPLTPEIAAAAATLPDSFPRDPFDRMITATALVEGLKLVTADEKIRKSNVVPVIW